MKKVAIILAILAAIFYAISTPISKILLNTIPVTELAGLLYLGAGIGIGIIYLIRKTLNKVDKESVSFQKSNIKYIVLMILLDIAAPICLLFANKYSAPETVSLLNNFEIVATSIIALIIFKEIISKKLWIGIGIITIASIMLSFAQSASVSFSKASLLAILSCICWGIENNCTKMLSKSDPHLIVIIKGFGSGVGSLLISLAIYEGFIISIECLYAIILGFVAYGLSVFCYVLAQRYLGASKVSAYYAVSPFIGAVLGLIIFNDQLNYMFYIALVLMVIGSIIITIDTLKKEEEVK